MATSTTPSQWVNEDTVAIATVKRILDEKAEAAAASRR